MIRGLLTAFFALCCIPLAHACAGPVDNPCAIRPEVQTVIVYRKVYVRHYYRPHVVYDQWKEAPPMPWYMHRWVPNTRIVGLCPTDLEGHWAIAQVGGINRIPKRPGDYIGMPVFVDASDGKVYRRPKGGYFYYDRDADKMAGS